mgnify:CR=1 FL=1
MSGFARAITLWVIGFVLSILLNKAQMKLLSSHSDSQSELNDIKTAKKHFTATFIVNCAALFASEFIPISAIFWIFFIGCGMLLSPVFYNVVYVCLLQTRNSKLRFLLTIMSLLNIILIAYTLIYIYYSNINKPFM